MGAALTLKSHKRYLLPRMLSLPLFVSLLNLSIVRSGYSAAKMPGDLASGFGLSAAIPIPNLLNSYFPGLGLIKPLMNGSGGGGVTTTSAASTPTPPSGGGGSSCSALYGQCGGIGWTGPTCCATGSCNVGNDYYSQVRKLSLLLNVLCNTLYLTCVV